MSTDIIIGASDRYEWPQLRNWVLSLTDSGFDGRKVIIAYRMDEQTAVMLRSHGVEVFWAHSDHHGRPIDYKAWVKKRFWPNRLRRLWKVATGSHVHNVGQNAVFFLRFFHIWQFLMALAAQKHRFVIASDISDVVFQSNPSVWLERNMADFKIVGSSESLRHKDEPWSRDTTERVFGTLVLNSVLIDQPVINAGVVAGHLPFIRDLCLQAYLLSIGSVYGNQDQAAMNLVLYLTFARGCLRLSPSSDGWVCQAGTLADPSKINGFRHHLLDAEPRLTDGVVYTAGGTKYCIVHQYNRVPEWKAAIDHRYANEGLSHRVKNGAHRFESLRNS